MLFLISPAKSLDYDTPLNGQPHSAPLFVPQSQALITLLRAYSPQQIAELMDLSDKLSALNVARYAAWKIERHTGVPVKLTPWRERHPILAAPLVLWQVWRSKGA